MKYINVSQDRQGYYSISWQYENDEWDCKWALSYEQVLTIMRLIYPDFLNWKE